MDSLISEKSKELLVRTVPCTAVNESCENACYAVETSPVVFHVHKLCEVPNDTECWYLADCVYMGHTGRWLPITKKYGQWGPAGGCRVIKSFLDDDHPSREQEMNPHTLVRVAKTPESSNPSSPELK